MWVQCHQFLDLVAMTYCFRHDIVLSSEMLWRCHLLYPLAKHRAAEGGTLFYIWTKDKMD